MSIDPDTYEARFGSVGRRVQRVARAIRWHGKALTGQPRHVLVEIRWRLGDEIMALPIYEAIKRTYPGCHLTVHCNHPDLLWGNTCVDAINTSSPVDRYILLRGAQRNKSRIERYAAKARVPTPDAPPALRFPDWRTPLLDEIAHAPKPWIAVSTGALWPTKRWPIAAWRAVVDAVQQSGATVVQVGAGDARLGVEYDYVDRTTVREAACILHAADAFVGCDSGLLHLALAAGTRSVALFGPTEPTILFSNHPKLMIIKNDRPCFGCWNDLNRMVSEGVCPLAIPECLGTIDPDRVVQAVQNILPA